MQPAFKSASNNPWRYILGMGIVTRLHLSVFRRSSFSRCSGYVMIRKVSTTALLVLTCVFLASCSGVSGGVCTNCGGGDATVSFVLTATPSPPSSQLSILAFTATMTGITLTPVTGTPVNVALNSTTYIAEFSRVTSDSTLLAADISVPAGTYTQMTVTFSAPRVTFCVQTNPGVPGCAAGTLTSLSGSSGSATISTALAFSANQQTGIVLNANLGNTLTLTGQSVSAVNLGAANVFSAGTLPRASTLTDLASGQLSHVDDVMGLVTNVGSSTVTVQTSTRGSITAVANSSTQYSTACSTQSFACVRLNSVAIVDAVLKADGTFVLAFYRPLFTSSVDIIEGVVTDVPNSLTNQFTIVTTDSVFASSGSLLNGQLNLGDRVIVTLSASPSPFMIVTKGLNIPTGSSFDNSTSITSVLPGQTVAFPVTTFTAQAGAVPGAASTSTLALRFTRVTGTVSAVAPPNFSGTNFAPFFGLPTSPQIFQTTTGRLSLDGVTDLGSLSSGNTFSTSALYLGSPANPIFAAQTVRAH
jgi:hypothetical protein